MGWLPVAMAVGGTAVKTIGAIQEGNQQSLAYKYQAQVAANNAQIAEENALYETRLGERQVNLEQMKGAQLASTQRAAAGGSGVDPNSGSALRLQEDTAAITAENTDIIRSDAARKAHGFTTQAGDFMAEEISDRAAAKNARRAGFTNALASLAGGSGSVAEKWYTYKARTPTGVVGTT